MIFGVILAFFWRKEDVFCVKRRVFGRGRRENLSFKVSVVRLAWHCGGTAGLLAKGALFEGKGKERLGIPWRSATHHGQRNGVGKRSSRIREWFVLGEGQAASSTCTPTAGLILLRLFVSVLAVALLRGQDACGREFQGAEETTDEIKG